MWFERGYGNTGTDISLLVAILVITGLFTSRARTPCTILGKRLPPISTVTLPAPQKFLLSFGLFAFAFNANSGASLNPVKTADILNARGRMLKNDR